jgi:C4-dicarboxylate transporter, DctM subunit
VRQHDAGIIACIYILFVLIPLLNRGHIRNLPRDFIYTGMLYAIPLAAVAAASALGWMLAYLRGPDIVAGWIADVAGNDPRMIMLLLVAAKFVGVSFARAMRALLPIYVVFIFTIAFVVLLPDVVLYLPKWLLPESVGCFKNPSGVGYICPG